jgi:hypothetical protein
MQKKPRNPFMIIATIFIGLTLATLLLFAVFTTLVPMCSNEMISSANSLNGIYVAYTFTRDCGATTSESYHLSILKKGQELKNKGGNTFISESKFEVEWESDNLLKVLYNNSSKVYEMNNKVGKVFVQYYN